MLSSAIGNDNEISLCLIARESTTITSLMLQEVVVLQGSKQRDDTIARCKDATIKYYTCFWLQGWQQKALFNVRTFLHHISRNNNKQRLIATKECKILPQQQPIKPLFCIAGASNNCGKTPSLMQWWCPTSCHKRLGWRPWWLIVTSAADCAIDNQPFSLMWINHINDCKGVKRQQ